MKRTDPPRFTVGQALAIGLMLLIGFIILPDGVSLVVLVAAMAFAAFLLNALFQWVLRWTTPPENERQDDP